MAIPIAVTTGGTAVLNAAKKYGPEAVKKAQEYLTRSGAGSSIANLAKGTDAEQAAAIHALSRGGLSLNTISKALNELTPEESTKWAGMVQSLRESNAQLSDKTASPRATSGDAELDGITRSVQIHGLCCSLNVSSDLLGELLTFFRSGTHADIEKYKRNYALLGKTSR